MRAEGDGDGFKLVFLFSWEEPIEPPITASVVLLSVTDSGTIDVMDQIIFTKEKKFVMDLKTHAVSGPFALPHGKEIDAADVMNGELIYFSGNEVYNEERRLGTFITPCDGVAEDVIRSAGIFTPDEQ